MKSNITFRVPGKCLLFGEYGVMKNGPALVATIPQYIFQFNCEIEWYLDQNAAIEIHSDFFQDTQKIHWFDILNSVNGKEFCSNHLASAFLCPLFVFLQPRSSTFDSVQQDLPKSLPNIKIKVVKCFSSSFGFGSSSAIISFSIALAKFLLDQKTLSGRGFLEDPQNWQKALQSLHLFQGKGSGYDVAIQLANLESNFDNQHSVDHVSENMSGSILDRPSSCFFRFQDINGLPNIVALPEFSVENRNQLHMGSLWGTSIYAPTKQILAQSLENDDAKQHSKTSLVENLFEEMKSSAKAFFKKKSELNNTNAETYESVLKESICAHLKIARKFGLTKSGLEGTLAQDDYENIVDALESNGITFKTTGAGKGDSIWIFEKDAHSLVSKINWKTFGFENCPIQHLVSL